MLKYKSIILIRFYITSMVVILRIVTFKIDEVLLEEVDRVAKTFGISRSEIIRDALSSYLRSIRVVRKNNINIKKVTLA